MKVRDLISMLSGYEEYDIRFDIDSVNLDLREPARYFPYTEVVEKLTINDVCHSEKGISLGYEEKMYFHRVLAME